MYYFASDIHLGAGGPETARRVERQFVAWLDGIESDAKALFLVGDIFDSGSNTVVSCRKGSSAYSANSHVCTTAA